VYRMDGEVLNILKCICQLPCFLILEKHNITIIVILKKKVCYLKVLLNFILSECLRLYKEPFTNTLL
jgi:hypothetical protein